MFHTFVETNTAHIHASQQSSGCFSMTKNSRGLISLVNYIQTLRFSDNRFLLIEEHCFSFSKFWLRSFLVEILASAKNIFEQPDDKFSYGMRRNWFSDCWWWWFLIKNTKILDWSIFDFLKNWRDSCFFSTLIVFKPFLTFLTNSSIVRFVYFRFMTFEFRQMIHTNLPLKTLRILRRIHFNCKTLCLQIRPKYPKYSFNDPLPVKNKGGGESLGRNF